MELNKNSKFKLNNDKEIPVIGLGVYQLENNSEGEESILHALKEGYRHIDTAAIYGNEDIVGKAIKKSNTSREEIFVTTKLWNDDHDNVEEAFNESLRKLNLDYIDLYLIHWPVSSRNESWKVFKKLYNEGKCKSIGVSNFTVNHLKELMEKTKIKPVVNQVEFNPFLFQKELLDFCKENNIQLVAYSPLTKGQRLNDENLLEIGKKYSKTSAQIILRWAIQHGVIVIPKSGNKERISENLNIFDFNIDEEDMKKLDSLNEDQRTSWDPNEVD
ncbi:aldo/keto reductase [archaeon]|nr:aldo/keto reductase [archaeon]